MGFFLETPFDVKPSDLVQPDLGHSRLEDAIAWLPIIEGAGVPRDFINNYATLFAGQAGWSIGEPGRVINFTTSGNDYVDVLTPAITGDITIAVYVKPVDITSDSYLSDFGGHNDFGLIIGFQSGYYNIFEGVYPFDNNAANSQIPATGEWDWVVWTKKGGTIAGYVNGVQHVNGSYTHGVWQPSANLRIGRAYIGSSYSLEGDISDYLVLNRAMSRAEVAHAYNNFYEPFRRSIWIPTIPSGVIELNIDGLNHARPVDQVDLSILATVIPIDSLRHSRAVDSLNLSISVDLFIAGLRHDRLVDAVDIDVSVSLVIDALRHGRFVDIVDIQELVGVLLIIGVLRHARPIDGLLLGIDQSIVIDNMRHSRPVDAAGVQPLLGDQTGIGATATQWILDAGQSLNNAALVDFDYHVLEGVFDSDQSVLGIDGTRVTGPAGMRELTALTLGANVDGQERVQGEIAELRIYAGALNQADRDRILQELQQKWITG